MAQVNCTQGIKGQPAVCKSLVRPVGFQSPPCRTCSSPNLDHNLHLNFPVKSCQLQQMDAASSFFYSVLPDILHTKHSHRIQQGSELARCKGPREKASHGIFPHVPRLLSRASSLVRELQHVTEGMLAKLSYPQSPARENDQRRMKKKQDSSHNRLRKTKIIPTRVLIWYKSQKRVQHSHKVKKTQSNTLTK